MPRRSFRSRARSFAHRARAPVMGKVMNGFAPKNGIIGAALSGLGAAYLSKAIPVNIPYKEPIAGFLAGGLPGAAAALLLPSVANMAAGVTGNQGAAL